MCIQGEISTSYESDKFDMEFVLSVYELENCRLYADTGLRLCADIS